MKLYPSPHPTNQYGSDEDRPDRIAERIEDLVRNIMFRPYHSSMYDSDDVEFIVSLPEKDTLIQEVLYALVSDINLGNMAVHEVIEAVERRDTTVQDTVRTILRDPWQRFLESESRDIHTGEVLVWGEDAQKPLIGIG